MQSDVLAVPQWVKRKTTITVTRESVTVYNHVGKTGVCIAVSTAVQVAARMLNEAECLGDIELDRETPRFVIRTNGKRRHYWDATIKGLLSVLHEVQDMNPGLLDIVERLS